MASQNGWTPTEQRIIDMLADGKARHKAELLTCLLDSQAEYNALRFHLSNMRGRLRAKGQDIVAVHKHRTTYYQQVRLLSDPNEE